MSKKSYDISVDIPVTTIYRRVYCVEAESQEEAKEKLIDSEFGNEFCVDEYELDGTQEDNYEDAEIYEIDGGIEIE